MKKQALIDGKYTYFAFICYTHADYDRARRLQKKLQAYGLPAKLAKAKNKSKRLIPVFLDEDDLLSGEYERVDFSALKESKYLIVVCSGNLHTHDARVNEEIEFFLSLGNSYDYVIPYIIDPLPSPETSCYPSTLIKLKQDEGINIVGPNIFEPNGKRNEKASLLKVIAKIHDIKATELENAHKVRNRRIFITSIFLVFVCIIACAVIINTSYPCTVNLMERLDGTTEWKENVQDVKVGDIVQFQFEFVNDRGFLTRAIAQFAAKNGLTVLTDDIMIRFVLPSNMEYIEDSTQLYNASHQNGVILADNDVTTSGINIGSYAIRGNAYVRIKCRIINSSLEPGDNELITWASATVNGKVNKDSASTKLFFPGV